jgi:hypothetical protein
VPDQRISADGKKKQPNRNKLSRFFNLLFDAWLACQYYFLIISFFVLMPVAFVCAVILAIPVLWSDLNNACSFVLASMGWNGIAESVFVPLGLVLGCRVLWFWKSIRSKKVKFNSKMLPCVVGRHDYAAVNRTGESDDYFDYCTTDSKCARCSAAHSETTSKPSINWYY